MFILAPASRNDPPATVDPVPAVARCSDVV